jgi:hypothetical protein
MNAISKEFISPSLRKLATFAPNKKLGGSWSFCIATRNTKSEMLRANA